MNRDLISELIQAASVGFFDIILPNFTRLCKMEGASNPTGGAAPPEHNNNESHRGRNFTIPQPIAEGEEQQQSSAEETDNKTSPAAALIDSVKQFFAPCVGAVDAASLYIGECRPSKDSDAIDQGENVAEDVIMRLRERNGGFRQQNMKRRGDTLEIPTHGMLFDDDDVSAISSHTLEEMERLRLTQSRLASFQMSPNIMRPKPNDAEQKPGVWNIQKEPVTQEATNLLSPIAVTSSDSSSSQENEPRTDDKALNETAPPSWGSKADEDGHFKTHPVA